MFLVELNESFSNFQQGIVNSCIDDLLLYKKEKYEEQTKESVNKIKTQDYLDSCIVFVYEKKNENITSFLNEINKLEIQKFKDVNGGDNQYISELQNVKIITSDFCGLGKSEVIKKK